jgi:hypothetical protein
LLVVVGDRAGHPAGFGSSDLCRGAAAGEPPGRDGGDLGVADRATGVDAEVRDAQQCGERVAAGGALSIEEPPGGEQDP